MGFLPAYSERPAMTAEEETYDFLLGAICSGRQRMGDRLIADDIAGEIGMSHMPVREAFHRLAAEGLVNRRPNRGAVVSGLNIEEMHEVFEMRSVLEGLTIRIAGCRSCRAGPARAYRRNHSRTDPVPGVGEIEAGSPPCRCCDVQHCPVT